MPHFASGSSFFSGHATARCEEAPHTKHPFLSLVFTALGHSKRLCFATVPHTKHHCSRGALVSSPFVSSPFSGQSRRTWPCFLQMEQVSPRPSLSRGGRSARSGSIFLSGHLNTTCPASPQSKHAFSATSFLRAWHSACRWPLSPQMWQKRLATRSGHSLPLWSVDPQNKQAPEALRCFSNSRLLGFCDDTGCAGSAFGFFADGSSSPSLTGASSRSSPASMETSSSSFAGAAVVAGSAAGADPPEPTRASSYRATSAALSPDASSPRSSSSFFSCATVIEDAVIFNELPVVGSARGGNCDRPATCCNWQNTKKERPKKRLLQNARRRKTKITTTTGARAGFGVFERRFR